MNSRTFILEHLVLLLAKCGPHPFIAETKSLKNITGDL